MANVFVKAEQVIRQALGVLEREIVLPALVWRDAASNFRGAKNDTVSLRVPAYTTARTRVLRGGTPITVDEIAETKVDISLDTDVYKAIGVSDEEMTLDIVDFGEQITAPALGAVARKMEDTLAAEMSAATHAVTIEVDNTDPYLSLIDARKALNDARVPMGQRALAVGSSIEAKILKSDHLSKFDQSGSDSAFREATIGRIAGFTAISAPGLNPSEGYAFHKSAFVLSSQAPVVPEGASWGRSDSFAGLAMRVLRDYDFLNVRDRLLVDTFIGTNHVLDNGYLDANGQFQPSTDDADSPAQAVTGVAATDVLTANGHGFANGDKVKFSALTGGAGLTAGTTFFVRDRTANTFKVAATAGGAAVDITSDLTAGNVAEQSDPILVRSVKLTDLA